MSHSKGFLWVLPLLDRREDLTKSPALHLAILLTLVLVTVPKHLTELSQEVL